MRIQTTIVILANYLFIYLYDQLHFNYNFGFFINIIIPFLSFLFLSWYLTMQPRQAGYSLHSPGWPPISAFPAR